MNAEQAVLDGLARRHPGDLAALLDALPHARAAEVLGELEPEAAGPVLARMSPVVSAGAIADMDVAVAAAALAFCVPGAGALILSRLNKTVRGTVLERLPEKVALAVKRLLAHRDDTAGALMDPLVLSVNRDMAAEQARKTIIEQSKDALYYLYVTARDHKLLGVVTLRELLAAPAEVTLDELMKDRPEAIQATATLTAVASHPGWRRFHAMPVVDREGRLLGAIRYETVRDVEHKLGQAVLRSPAAETAEALADFYTVGLMGMARSLIPSGKNPPPEGGSS